MSKSIRWILSILIIAIIGLIFFIKTPKKSEQALTAPALNKEIVSKDKGWYGCNQNDECIAVNSSCGLKIAVNAKYKAEVEKHFLDLQKDSVIECAKAPNKNYVVSCENSRCKGEYK